MKQAKLNEGVTSPNQNKARIDEMKIKTWEVLFFFSYQRNRVNSNLKYNAQAGYREICNE